MSDPNRGRPRKKKQGPEPALLRSDGDATGFRSFSLNSKRGYWKKKREDDQGDLQENGAPPCFLLHSKLRQNL